MLLCAILLNHSELRLLVCMLRLFCCLYSFYVIGGNVMRKTMKRDYLMERSGYDDYDDIYPSILKQQPSHFKSLLLGLCLRFMHLWHKVCYIKKT